MKKYVKYNFLFKTTWLFSIAELGENQQCETLLVRNDICVNHYRGDIRANKYEKVTLVQMF